MDLWEFEVSQDYAEKVCLKNNQKQNKNQTKPKPKQQPKHTQQQINQTNKQNQNTHTHTHTDTHTHTHTHTTHKGLYIFPDSWEGCPVDWQTHYGKTNIYLQV
jgi:hypothetical protein